MSRFASALLFAVVLPLGAQAHPAALDHLDNVSRLQLDDDQVQREIEKVSLQSNRYAVAQDLQITDQAGSWEERADGSALWRLRVASTGAASLSLHLSGVHLPAGAELWLYTADGNDMQGPYTAADGDSIWTAIARGEEVVLEASMPAAAREQFQLTVAQAFHGYRALDNGLYQPKGYFGSAGACTIDTACSDGDNWRQEIRSTVLVTIANTTLCSGTLVNNTAQDDRALILTANHCGITSSNVTQTKAYFNVQKASCGGSSSGSVSQNIAGKTLLAATASGNNTDYSLFELASKPPSSYNTYYSGWDISGAVPTSGVGISHPAGDDKKISTFSSPASLYGSICIGTLGVGNVCVGFTIKALAINWSRGATQGGSSGSGLWNENHRIVGTLSGGTSGCASSNSSQTNGGTDMYARLDMAWAATSVTGNTLKSVLDPLSSSCSGIDGKTPGSSDVATCASGSGSSSGGSSSSGSSGSSSGAGSSDASGGGGSWGFGLLPLALLALCTIPRRHLR